MIREKFEKLIVSLINKKANGDDRHSSGPAAILIPPLMCHRHENRIRVWDKIRNQVVKVGRTCLNCLGFISLASSSSSSTSSSFLSAFFSTLCDLNLRLL